VDTSRKNFDVLTIANQTTKEAFRDRAAANITCANKEDAFHGSRGASERQSNLEANGSKSIQVARGLFFFLLMLGGRLED